MKKGMGGGSMSSSNLAVVVLSRLYVGAKVWNIPP